ncbi:hypothetical protein FPQ18DRAFT_306399 [Pyronema domesticum]|nr:hypothetical protein FPQ18DRAFT_306399 [Pyronema domesticum]
MAGRRTVVRREMPILCLIFSSPSPLLLLLDTSSFFVYVLRLSFNRRKHKYRSVFFIFTPLTAIGCIEAFQTAHATSDKFETMDDKTDTQFVVFGGLTPLPSATLQSSEELKTNHSIKKNALQLILLVPRDIYLGFCIQGLYKVKDWRRALLALIGMIALDQHVLCYIINLSADFRSRGYVIYNILKFITYICAYILGFSNHAFFRYNTEHFIFHCLRVSHRWMWIVDILILNDAFTKV